MDGANVEIYDAVGDDNIFIFGMNTPEVAQLQVSGYHPMEYINNNETLRNAIDFIRYGVNGKRFDEIVSSLINVDPYMALADFADYHNVQQRISSVYQDKLAFARMSLMNISGAGVFSADRSIMDYANNIWHTKPVNMDAEKPRTSKKSAPMAPKKKKAK
jgi:starch phosphorylase